MHTHTHVKTVCTLFAAAHVPSPAGFSEQICEEKKPACVCIFLKYETNANSVLLISGHHSMRRYIAAPSEMHLCVRSA